MLTHLHIITDHGQSANIFHSHVWDPEEKEWIKTKAQIEKEIKDAEEEKKKLEEMEKQKEEEERKKKLKETMMVDFSEEQ